MEKHLIRKRVAKNRFILGSSIMKLNAILKMIYVLAVRCCIKVAPLLIRINSPRKLNEKIFYDDFC